MSFIVSILDSIFPTRKGKFSCGCGSIKGELTVPGSSYCLVEQTTAICHCQDCVGFARACGEKGPSATCVIENNGTQLVQFYKSDVKLLGNSHAKVGKIKVRPNTPLIRCYCIDCGTPLGGNVEGVPILLLYSKLIESGPIYPAFLVLNFASADDTTRPYSRAALVRSGLFAPWFVFRVILRVLLGFILGKGIQGGFSAEKDKDNFEIGLDKIHVSTKNKQT